MPQDLSQRSQVVAVAGPKLPLTLFGIQLVLNLWSCIFFGLEIPGLAFAEVLLLWAAIAATMVTFWQNSMIAGLLFAPYLAWVSFASVLNYAIWRLNATRSIAEVQPVTISRSKSSQPQPIRSPTSIIRWLRSFGFHRWRCSDLITTRFLVLAIGEAC
jgi:hypothetical protein